MRFDDDEDRGDLSRFFVDHKQELLGFARFLTGDHHEAQELLGETAEKLAKSWHKSKNKDMAYARTVMRNSWLDILRARKRRPKQVSLDGLVEQEDGSPHLDHAAAVRANITSVMKSLNTLELSVFTMRAHKGLGFKDIAAILYVSESSAFKAWQRVEKKLMADD